MLKPRAFVLKRRETVSIRSFKGQKGKHKNVLHEGNSCLTSTDTGLSAAVVFEGKTDFQHQMPEIQTFKARPWEPPTQRDPSAPQSHDWAATAECRSLLWGSSHEPQLQPGTDAPSGDSPSSPLLHWPSIGGLGPDQGSFLCLRFLGHFSFLVLQSHCLVSGNNFLWPLF